MWLSLPKLLLSTACIFAFLWVGLFIQHHTVIPLPGSIIGMLLMFFALSLGLIPEELVRVSASLMLKYMMLFFIPISVGLINYFDFLFDNMVLILACTIASNLVVTIILSVILRTFSAKEEV